MVLYEVTTYQMTQNLNINAQNLDRLSEKSDWASISGASPRKELLLELIKTAKTYSRQLEQLSEEVLLEVKSWWMSTAQPPQLLRQVKTDLMKVFESFTFQFSEYLNDRTKRRKLLLLDYSIE